MVKKRSWVEINRAPALTLWAAIVAERMGFRKDEALTLGRAVAGLNAYSKGRSIGIFKPNKQKVAKTRKSMKSGKTIRVDLMNRAVPATRTKQGIRAVSKGKAIAPDNVQEYLENKFGDALDDTRNAMRELARSYSPRDLAACAYDLYVQFRPRIPGGKKGWGAKGRLSMSKITSLAE